MSPVVLLWVVALAVLWVGVVAGVWALLAARGEYPSDVSRPSTNE